MTKDDSGNRLNLTVVALVALVAIVGLVALVLNTAGLARLSTGGSLASASEDANAAGQIFYQDYGDLGGSGTGSSCSNTNYCTCKATGGQNCGDYCTGCSGTDAKRACRSCNI